MFHACPAQHMAHTTGKESIPVWLCTDTGVTNKRRANMIACVLKVETDLKILAVPLERKTKQNLRVELNPSKTKSIKT